MIVDRYLDKLGVEFLVEIRPLSRGLESWIHEIHDDRDRLKTRCIRDLLNTTPERREKPALDLLKRRNQVLSCSVCDPDRALFWGQHLVLNSGVAINRH